MKFLTFLLCPFLAFGLPTPDFQAKGTTNIALSSEGNLGITIGAVNYEYIMADVAIDVDVNKGSKPNIAAKIGYEEDVMFSHAPSINVGVTSAGIKTKRTVTDHANVFHVMLSKSLREFMNARIYVGAFRGNKLLGKQKNGMFYGYTHYFFPALQQDLTDYHKLAVDATYVTGDSQLSGAGFLVKYYINSKMSLQGGPRWNFRDVTISSSKWSLEKVKWIVILSIDL